MRFGNRDALILAVLLVAAGWPHTSCAQGVGTSPAPVKAPDSGTTAVAELQAVTPHGPGETLESVQARIRRFLGQVHTLKADVEMSRARKGKSRKVSTGPMEVARQQGARVALTRKGETEEYIANPRVIWSYEHKEREAKYIPTNLPVVEQFVGSAMGLDLLLALDAETVRLLGNGTCDGEPCWVLEGKSPDTLEMLGVPVVKMKIWVSKSDGLPRRIWLPKQNDTLILLRKVKINPTIAAGRFQWSPPKGVKTKNIFGF